MRKKAFTLIELIAVLVILAILALIVTPLVMNIIRKARISADKRSIDAYGRSVELAIANYLLDNGDFPSDISQLSIEYSGDRVECLTTQINSDSSVYLAGCTVAGRSVEGYIFGKEETVTYNAYKIGDQVTYNNIDYYVIANSDEATSTVTLLKAEPLTVAEVNEYGVGHVNMHTAYSRETANDHNGYGGMSYYSSEQCGDYRYSECTNDYETSEIKYVVDAWKLAQAPAAIEVSLITKDQLVNDLDFELDEFNNLMCTNPSYSWLYSEWGYWILNPDEAEEGYAGIITSNTLGNSMVVADNGGGELVRPVITISKSAI